MDWHKLQHTLYNLDPTDPREDLARLQQSAQKPVDDIPSIDYVNESVEVPKGSMPLNISSVNDFARLAGVEPRKQINEDDSEKKPTGFAAGYQAVQKGGRWGPDAAERYVKDKLSPGKPDKKKTDKQDKTKLKGSLSAMQIAKMLNVSEANAFVQAVNIVKKGDTITNRIHQKALAEGFVRLMQMDPQQTQKTMTMLKRVQADEGVSNRPQTETVTKKEYSSIKEELYKMLNSKK